MNFLIRFVFWCVVTANVMAETTVSPLDKQALTPLGAERAGNTAGTIPAWEGGITTPPSGYVPGEHHVDPFPDDRPRLIINASNLDEHADRLSPGQQALLRAKRRIRDLARDDPVTGLQPRACGLGARLHLGDPRALRGIERQAQQPR